MRLDKDTVFHRAQQGSRGAIASVPSIDEAGLISRWRRSAPYLLSTLRIVAAFLFIQFGTAKWFAFPGAITPDGATVPLASLAGVAAFLETVGGFLLLLGAFTRPVAFLLSGEMAFAYFIGHAPQGFWPVLNQGSIAALFAFVWLYFSAAGPGPWSVDSWRGRTFRAQR
jgi:putative oxidoreductase